MTNKHLHLEGMHCSACVTTVEQALKSLRGVNDVSVNLLANTAVVTVNESLFSESQAASVVSAAGYTLTHVTAEPSGASHVRVAQLKSASAYQKQLLIAAPFAFVVFTASMSLMFVHAPAQYHTPINIALLVLSIPVMWAGRWFFVGAIRALRARTSTMDTLVAIGSGSAFVYSVVLTLAPSINLASIASVHVGAYFDTATTIIVLILFGKWLEARAKSKTSEALEKLMALQPAIAHVQRDGRVVDIAASELEIGDVMVVRQGESIPADGVVQAGIGSVNESMITGESALVYRKEHTVVIGGTLLVEGSLEVRVTAHPTSSVLASIVDAVERAQSSKAPLQRLADKISSVFVPLVLLIALATFVVWMFAAPSNNALPFALNAAIAVLIIACPCALGLATPAAIAVGSGAAARAGLLFANAESLEVLQECTTVVVDKTGTLTKGHPAVHRIVQLDEQTNMTMLWSKIVAAESRSEHPIAKAFVDYGAEHYPNALPADCNDIEFFVGKGLIATFGNEKLRIGSEELLADALIIIPQAAEDAARELVTTGATVQYVAINRNVVLLVGTADEVRADSAAAVAQLQGMGVSVHMASGDTEASASMVAQTVGIQTVLSRVKPADKLRHVEQLIRSQQKVVMAGDGINDAPALAAATVGVAMGAGTDVAKTTADVTLVSNSLMSLVHAFRISKLTVTNIKQNLFFAFAYNVLGIPIAAGVLYSVTGWLLSPMIAAVAMALSSVTVVTNALRLRSIT